MFLSICMQSNYLFQTITQSFYIASSHINIPTRIKISAGVLIIRRGNNYTRGRKGAVGVRQWVAQKKLFEKISQCRKLSHSAENESVHIFIH